MKALTPALKNLIPGLAALALGACAQLGGPPLTPGVSTLADLEHSLGAPAMRWRVRPRACGAARSSSRRSRSAAPIPR